METIEMHIDGMSCGHCVARVDRALEGLDGVRAEVQLGSARVEYDPTRVTVQQITDAIREAGYEAHPVESRAA
jgi:copper chaperone